jgi:hypothetical protein
MSLLEGLTDQLVGLAHRLAADHIGHQGPLDGALGLSLGEGRPPVSQPNRLRVGIARGLTAGLPLQPLATRGHPCIGLAALTALHHVNALACGIDGACRAIGD